MCQAIKELWAGVDVVIDNNPSDSSADAIERAQIDAGVFVAFELKPHSENEPIPF